MLFYYESVCITQKLIIKIIYYDINIEGIDYYKINDSLIMNAIKLLAGIRLVLNNEHISKPN